MAFVTVSVPISDWWGGSHKLKEHKIKIEQAQNKLQETSELLTLQIEQAKNELNETYFQIKTAGISVDQSSENLKVVSDNYKAGVSTMKDKREIWPVYIEFGIPAVIGIALPVAIVFIMKQDVTHHLVLYIVSSLVFLAIGINIIRFIVKKQIDKVFLLTVGLFGSLLLFGLPLLSSDLIGKPLHPISGLKTESDVKHIKVYCYDFIAPEMIWQYGDKISMKMETCILLSPKYSSSSVGSTTTTRPSAGAMTIPFSSISIMRVGLRKK